MKRDFTLPTSASIFIQRRPRKNAHLHKRPHRPPSQIPMPLREDLEGTKRTLNRRYPCRCPCPLPNRLCPQQHAPTRPPAPISTQRKKKRTEAQKQNERPVLPQEIGRRQTAAHRRLTLICLQVEPRTRSTFTWHCYTRCSSCGLTIGPISDRRKVNFPKTFYTHFPRIFPLRQSFTCD